MEKRDRSLEIKIVGSKEEIQIMIAQIDEIVKEIAPQAIITKEVYEVDKK